MGRHWTSLERLALLGTAAVVALHASGAAAADKSLEITSPKGPLGPAIVRLAELYDIRVMAPTELVAGRFAPAIRGRYTAREAIDRLLLGSGLETFQAAAGVLVVRPVRLPVSIQRSVSGAGPIKADDAPLALQPADLVAADDVTALEEIVVGTHLRGGRERASPVVTLGQADIDRGGYISVGDALMALPQTFGGTASDRTNAIGADATGTNAGRSTGVNLRGLGADATLVLVNGRRMAGAGIMADFSDVAGLPLAAVERIEVLLDGASALYGSDAVGGVVNIVMRDRFEGLETRARLGAATQGGLAQRQLSQTYGKAWSTGSMVASAEYQRTGNVRAADRAYLANADLREFGGADHRLYYAQPANILGSNYLPAYAIPAGQSGTALTPSSFTTGPFNYTNQNAVMDALPSQERFGLYLAGKQALGERVTLDGEIRYSDRRYSLWNLAPLATLTVTSANPYFVSPTGASSHLIAYDFQNETGASKNTGSVQSRNYVLGAKVVLPADWRLDAYAVHGEEISLNRNTGLVNSAALNEALGNTADSPLSSYSASRDGYFNPFIGQGRNSQAVLDFVVSGWDTRRTIGQLDTASVTADGALFKLPAGSVRLALGAQVRTETLKTTGVTTSTSLTPIAGFTRRGERTVKAAFAEARVPLFGPDFRRTGFERLELSAAVRHEAYEGGMAATTPKVGVAWAPVEPLTLRATYGESFRAPSIGQLTDAQGATPVRLSNGATSVLTLILYGGNPSLKPETAKSWTAGFDFAPQSRPQLRLSGTVFETKFENRIGRPAINYLATILTASDLAPFRTYVSPATNAADLALVKSYLTNASAAAQALYTPEAYGAIGDARYVNAGSFTVSGVDLTGSWRTTVREDPLTFSGNVSWLTAYKRKVTQTSTAVELAGLAGYPADLRARLSAAWTHGEVTTTLSANHTGDLHTETGRRMASLTTFDLQAQWTPKASQGAWRGTSVALTVTNLLDKDPPFYDSPQYVGYDPANYDPSGRVVALQLTKAW
ncbi:TonB-dependent receptor [Caulobacter hibisci]|uniref:TonB-dependent receptor n=1 Tax=Caulobacter hibisci TaxID=2035993 RepID=A0ABS0T6R5_9CAUL|nr:TonB-dependent receptor [Caulobacter hibisci]